MTIRGRPLLGQERAAESRARAESREVVDGHELREHALRITIAQAHVQRGERVGDQILDAVGAALAQVGKCWQGNVAVLAPVERGVERDDAVGVFNTVEEMAQAEIEPAVHADIRANSEAERDDGDHRERGLLHHQPPAVAEILGDHLESPDMHPQPERMAEGTGDAREETRARGDAAILPLHPLPLVRDIGAPLAAPLASP